MTDAEEETYLVCVPWDARNEYVVSAPDVCFDCGQTVAVAHSSRAVLDTGATIICHECARKMLDRADAEGEDVTIAPAKDGPIQ